MSCGTLNLVAIGEFVIEINKGQWMTMSESRKLSELAEQIIQYQKRHDQTDNELAFNSHVSVEHIHAIKAMEMTPPADDVRRITAYIQGN